MSTDNRIRYCCWCLLLCLACDKPVYADGASDTRSMFQACIQSGGRPSGNNYNDWVAGNGCICPPATTGSGQVTCSGSSNSSSGSGSSGDLMTDSTKNVVQGMMNNNAQQTGVGMMGMGAAILIQGMQTDPAQEAARQQRAQEAAAERQRIADENARAAEQAKQRLLGNNSDPNGLSLMGVDQSPDLQLMTGDEAEGFMPDRKPSARPINEPRAVIKQAQAPAPSMPEENKQDPAPGKEKEKKKSDSPKSDAFARGFEHGSGCFSQNAGATCSGASAEDAAACVDDYRRGYHEGDKAARFRIDLAYRSGARDKADGLLANGASQPDADGGCRTQIIEAYNSGYAGAPHP